MLKLTNFNLLDLQYLSHVNKKSFRSRIVNLLLQGEVHFILSSIPNKSGLYHGMSSVASPLGPESPFPCLRGGALFDTLRRRHDGRLPVLHVTTCPGHVAVRFRLNAQSTRQKESTVCRVTSISLGSTEHGLGRDCIVTLLFDSGHGRRWAMPSTRNLHAFIDNICTEDDEKFCNASDSLRSKRDVDSQLDSPLLAVPYASENVLLEVFQGEPWMPHLKTVW